VENKDFYLQESYQRARGDPEFLSQFYEQFRPQLTQELSRGKTGKSDARKPRPGRCSLEELANLELVSRKNWFKSESQRFLAGSVAIKVQKGEPLTAKYNKDRVDSLSFDVALRFIATTCKQQWRPGKTQSTVVSSTTLSNLPLMQREHTIKTMWDAYATERDKGNRKIEGPLCIDRDAFYRHVNGTAKEVEKKACLSYY